jgi:hypothetical protein
LWRDQGRQTRSRDAGFQYCPDFDFFFARFATSLADFAVKRVLVV